MFFGVNMFTKRILVSLILLIFLLLMIVDASFYSNSLNSNELSFISYYKNTPLPDKIINKFNKPRFYSVVFIPAVLCLAVYQIATRDSNRNPLTLKVYRKSVYQAFHPDSNFV